MAVQEASKERSADTARKGKLTVLLTVPQPFNVSSTGVDRALRCPVLLTFVYAAKPLPAGHGDEHRCVAVCRFLFGSKVSGAC
jgi:hypothetical protein